eukprot:UN1254
MSCWPAAAGLAATCFWCLGSLWHVPSLLLLKPPTEWLIVRGRGIYPAALAALVKCSCLVSVAELLGFARALTLQRMSVGVFQML